MTKIQQMEDQHQKVTTIARQIQGIVTFWPVIVILFLIISTTVTIVVSAVSYNNSIVKKPDLVALSNKVDNISKHQVKKDIIDSLKNERIEEHLQRIEEKLKIRTTGFSTEQYVNGKLIVTRR